VIVPRLLPLGAAAVTQRCEQLIRNYDPCISCATHAIRVVLEGVTPTRPAPSSRP
jgi:sulfhydrogenase subunit alpha